MSDDIEIPFNYEDCHDASIDAREAEEELGQTLGEWLTFGDATRGDVVADYKASTAADNHAENICDFGEDNGGGNSFSLDLF